jgi:hypothetical protein
VVCCLIAGISESQRMPMSRQRLGNHVSCIIVWVTHSHVNAYITDRCIGKQEIEAFDKVLSTRLGKDCLKEMQTQIGTVNRQLRQIQTKVTKEDWLSKK